MIRVEYFCTQCNPSAQRRDPGDEVNTGYTAELHDKPERAKKDAPPVPNGWRTDANGYLICNACIAKDTAIANRRPESPVRRDAAEAESFNEHYGLEGDARVTPADARLTGWPSKASPFDGG